MNKTAMTIFFLVFALLSLTCTDEGTPPPGYQRTISLTAEDLGTTEAWLRVRFADAPPYSFRLMRDSHTVATVFSAPADTLIGDETLLPSRTYTYRAYRLWGAAVSDSSEAVTVRTMDTTSSAWHWALDTLGDMNSYLVDCAIINDTLIYAVGEIYKRDSLGNWDPNAYNAVKWNGRTWELKRIPFIGPCSAVDYPPIRAVWAFSETNILFARGGSIVRYNGTNAVLDCGMNSLLAGSINKIYATSPQDVYLVGNAGTIIHYDGTTWRRLESGTRLALSDVWGVSASEVYAVGLNSSQFRGVVLRGNQQGWQTMIEGFPTTQVDPSELFRTKLYGTTGGVWADERRRLYTVGNLMYRYRHGKWDYMRPFQGNCPACNPGFLYYGYLHAIRANASNDILVVGEINTLRHYNGVRWSEVGLPYRPLKPDIFWYGCAVKGNTAVAVGKIPLNFNRGIVMRLWR